MTQASKSEAENERALLVKAANSLGWMIEVVDQYAAKPCHCHVCAKARDCLTEINAALSRGDHLPSLAEQEKDV
jgi:hypothetical protein